MEDHTAFFERAWTLLRRGAVDKRHGFSLGTFTTMAPAGSYLPSVPCSRTVVVRTVDSTTGTITCYTDVRSRKVDQLSSNPNAAWCLWDKRSNMQISAYGPVTIAHDETTRQQYLSLPKHSRKAYATLTAPGTAVTTGSRNGLPEDWEDVDLKATDYGAEHFAVLTTHLLSMDILELGRHGHRRLKASRDTITGDWSLTWVVP